MPDPDAFDDECMVVMAFDVGLRYIGVAVGQSLTGTARPLPVLRRHNEQWPWPDVRRCVREWSPRQLLVGYPYNMDGSDSPIVPYAKDFAAQLAVECALPVAFVDERLSTRAAYDRLPAKAHFKAKKRSNLDGVAAQVLVEQWLIAYAKTGRA